MASTILNPLGRDYYSRGLGPVFLFPEGETVGYRLGDPESVAVSFESEAGEDIVSNEYSEEFVVGSTGGKTKIKVKLVIKQLSEIVRAASLKGSLDKLDQTAATDQEFVAPSKGVYHIAGFDLQNVSVTKSAGGAAVEGTDYMIDVRSGMLENLTNGSITVKYDLPLISGRFATGVASGEGIKGKLTFVGLNKDGKRSMLVLNSVALKPAGSREFVSAEIQKVELEGDAYPVAGQRAGFSVGYEVDLPALAG